MKPTREQMLAERNELLIRDRDTFARNYNEAQEKLQAAKAELTWNSTAVKAANSAKTDIIQSLDQVRAAVDKLSGRITALEQRFPSKKKAGRK